MPPRDLLQNIYERIEEKRKSKDPRYVRSFCPTLTDKETTDYACRMYQDYMDNREKRKELLRQKHEGSSQEVKTSKHTKESMSNMATRLCPIPAAPSILKQILQNTSGSSTSSSSASVSSSGGHPATSSGRSSPSKASVGNTQDKGVHSDSYEDDFNSPEEHSPSASSKAFEDPAVESQRSLLLTTLSADKLSVKTFIARHDTSVLRQLARPHRSVPPPGEREESKLPEYDATQDEHLIWYWKSRVRHQRQLRARAERDRERWLRDMKKKERLYDRLQSLRPYYRPLFVLPHLQKEKLCIEEARARVFIQMKESDAWKDIKNQLSSEMSSENPTAVTSPMSDEHAEYSDDYTEFDSDEEE